MKLSDIIQSKDGSLSLTKLAASTAHLSMAVSFVWITYKAGFVAEMWLIYGSFAMGHAAYDKTMATVNDFKTKQMERPL